MVRARPFSHLLLTGTLAACAVSACGEDAPPNTQLVLVADTDIPRVDNVEFTIEAAGVEPKSASASYATDRSPVYLTVLRDQGPLGPLTVRARGREGTTVLVTRTHVVSFVPDSTRVVPLHLLRSCVGKACSATQTCSESGCVEQRLDATGLPVWSGTPPSVVDTNTNMMSCGDAGVVDLLTNVKHCGSCNNACRSNEQCSAGGCVKK